MMQAFQQNSYLFGGNAPYVEELYENYLNNPASVPDTWRAYFENAQLVAATDGNNDTRDQAHAPVVDSFAQRAKANAFVQRGGVDEKAASKQAHVQGIIGAYRFLGSRWADLDPLHRTERPNIPELDPAFYGLSEADMDTQYSAVNTYFGAEKMSLRNLIKALRDTYCSSIGAEFMYISEPAEKRWMQQRLESIRSKPVMTETQKKRILEQLTAAEGLERYLHTKYVGQKRFSLEGGESFIASMDEVIQHSGKQGVQEIVLGMAHRGRLNVLVNTLGKMPKDLFAEFEGKYDTSLSAGDVKYHKGFSSDISTAGGPVHLSLAFNPSHLEIVNPVVEGSVRARQDRRGGDMGKKQVLAVLVHGDAAFAGQGVVMETLNLALTRGYRTGGTIHIVINNQIGFTTSDPRDSRSTTYCSDVVKMIEAPVLHVNADDPEAVSFASQLAVDYRTEFGKDIVVDIICYRKLGHNEQDTPALTQPLMYKSIAAHPGTRKLYADKLETQGTVPAGYGDEQVKAYRAAMDVGQHTREVVLTNFSNKFAVDWAPQLRPLSLTPQTAAFGVAVPVVPPDTNLAIEDTVAAILAAGPPDPVISDSRLAVANARIPQARPQNFADVVASAQQRSAPAAPQNPSLAVIDPPPEPPPEPPAAPAPAAVEPDVQTALLPESAIVDEIVAPTGPIPGGVATNATLDQAIDLREVNLIGVFGRPNDRRALVRLANGRFVRVGVGDSLDGGQVAAIGDNALNYVKRGQTITIAIPNG